MRDSLEDKLQILQEVDKIIRLTISVFNDLTRFSDRAYIEPSTTRAMSAMSAPLILIAGNSLGVDERL